MNRRRARGIVVHGLLSPAATLVLVAVATTAVGYSLGLAVFFLSVVSAAGVSGMLLTQTRNTQPDGLDGGPTGRTDRGAIGLRSELTDDPDIENSRQIVLTRYTAGLFVQTVLAVLYLGGLFGG